MITLITLGNMDENFYLYGSESIYKSKKAWQIL